jgi:hypothetical protein
MRKRLLLVQKKMLDEAALAKLHDLVVEKQEVKTIETLETHVEVPLTFDTLLKTANERGKQAEIEEAKEADSKELPVRHACVIPEDNLAKRWWDLFIILLIVYVATVVPYRMAFDGEDNKNWRVWNNIMNASFALDTVLTFFTSYYDATTFEQVYNLRKIARNYLRLWFWIDLVSIAPIEFVI